MKRLVWGLVLLLAISFASASYFPQPGIVFEYKDGSCYQNGSMAFNITHEGNDIYFKDIKITAESKELGPIPVSVKWFDKYSNTYYNSTGNNFFGKRRYKFITTNPIFTKGNYIITLSWPSNDIYNDHIKFGVECPGITCKNNDECISQQSCINKTCEWLKCSEDRFAMGHTCLPKCNDYDKCTNDYYIDSQCTYIKIEGCPAKELIEENNIFAVIWKWLKSRYK